MRQWAILIGLNQYQNQMFQPLTCAQQDAQALHRALVHEAGFPAEQCLLMTDTSPAISGRSTQPTRANLQTWLALLAQHVLKPGDTLWFFFSGYGISSGGIDYLVPLDGDPFAVETTCVPVADIFNWLQQAVLPGLSLMAFDINRSQGNYSNENVGLQSAQLARKFAVPLMLSCHPGQYSREVSGLGHGLFTIALLDALRYHQAATPATLMRFLGDRLPELGAYYYLPNQQPLCFCPQSKLHQPLLQSHFSSQSGTNNGNGNYAMATAADSLPNASMEQMQSSAASEVNDRSAAAISTLPSLQVQPVSNLTSSGSAIDLNQSDLVQPNGQSVYATATQPALPSPVPTTSLHELSSPPPSSLSMPVAPVPPTQTSSEDNSASRLETSSDSESSSALWLPILFWGGLLSLGLIGCVLWRNWSEIQTPSPVSTPAPAPAPTVSPTPIVSPSATTDNTPLPPAATTPSVSPTTAPVPPTTASPAPLPDRPLEFNPAASPVPIVGQELLRKTRQMVLSDQATPYRDAIDVLKQVPSTDPAFADAQQDIAIWSQRIFNIAQLRATQKQWDIAIMAADLVPMDNPTLYPQAKAAIAQWCPAIQPLPATTFPLQKAKAICNQKPI